VVLIDPVADLGSRASAPQSERVAARTRLSAGTGRSPRWRCCRPRRRGRSRIETNCFCFRFMLSSAAASPRAGREHGACQPEGTEKRRIGACPSWKLQVSALVAVAFCKARRFCSASLLDLSPRRGTT